MIVVGAHLRAEVNDRPLSYRLRDAVEAWLAAGEWAVHQPPVIPIVCTDLWYLNQDDLMQRPTIAIGEPGVNAATAYFANRLPGAFMVEGSMQVQMDLEGGTPAACIWGADHAATAAAVETFIERYLDSFLDACTRHT